MIVRNIVRVIIDIYEIHGGNHTKAFACKKQKEQLYTVRQKQCVFDRYKLT